MTTLTTKPQDSLSTTAARVFSSQDVARFREILDQDPELDVFYGPQAPPAGVQLASSAVVAANPGGVIFPLPSGATTTEDGYGTRAGRPSGYMHRILDVTASAVQRA